MTNTHEDWTVDPVSHCSNSSPVFLELTRVITQLIRDEAYALIHGRTEHAAGLILAQLAHRYHFTTDLESAEQVQRIYLNEE